MICVNRECQYFTICRKSELNREHNKDTQSYNKLDGKDCYEKLYLNKEED